MKLNITIYRNVTLNVNSCHVRFVRFSIDNCICLVLEWKTIQKQTVSIYRVNISYIEHTTASEKYIKQLLKVGFEFIYWRIHDFITAVLKLSSLNLICCCC